MDIIIKNKQKNIFIKKNIFTMMKKIINIIFKTLNITEKYIISILITNNTDIKNMNNKYRKINSVTDVLSFKISSKNFCAEEPRYINNNKDIIFADIAISAEKAKEQSVLVNHSFDDEIYYLLIHSILHILGYDHSNKYNKNKMRNLEKKFLFNFGFK